MSETTFHMSSEEFRKNGKAVIDWIADYYNRVEEFPVLSNVKPGEIRASLPESPPTSGEKFQDIMADVEKFILPGVTHWRSPNFFAYFPANSSGPAVLGDLMSSGLGIQGMLWSTSPACTELETQVLDWIADMLDLPRSFKSDSEGGGVIQESASGATLCAVLAARERATNFASNAQGCDGKLVAYSSREAHSSIEKAVKIAGYGSANLRLIEVDGDFAMRPEDLKQQIEKDKTQGLIPAFVCVTVGTTSSLALDSITKIGEVCQAEGLWLHVDVAMAGTAALCPEYRYIHNGLALADSYVFDPHKWMFTNFDCSCMYVKDRQALIKTLGILPEYLRNQATETGEVLDYRDWQIPLGRRFRALKLWFVIRSYGVEGLQFHVRRHVELAQNFAQWVRESDDFELCAPAPLNLVCFRSIEGDDFNRALMQQLNESGEMYLTHTILRGRFVLRMCIGQTTTEETHVIRAWKRITETATRLKIDSIG